MAWPFWPRTAEADQIAHEYAWCTEAPDSDMQAFDVLQFTNMLFFVLHTFILTNMLFFVLHTFILNLRQYACNTAQDQADHDEGTQSCAQETTS